MIINESDRKVLIVKQGDRVIQKLNGSEEALKERAKQLRDTYKKMGRTDYKVSVVKDNGQSVKFESMDSVTEELYDKIIYELEKSDIRIVDTKRRLGDIVVAPKDLEKATDIARKFDPNNKVGIMRRA